MKRKIAMLVLVAILPLVSAESSCGSGKAPRNARVPVPEQSGPNAQRVETPDSVTQAIKGMCDFYEARPHEVLLKPEAEGNVVNFRSTPGFPGDLGDATRDYYRVYAKNPPSKEQRAALDAAYDKIIKSCQKHGWKP